MLLENLRPQFFDTSKTDSPDITRVVNNDDPPHHPGYWKDYKGWEAEIVQMTPEEYLRRANRIFYVDGDDSVVGDVSNLDMDRVREYAKAMEGGSKFPMPYLDYRRKNDPNQEGRHRSKAAELAGMDRIPVVIVRSNRDR